MGVNEYIKIGERIKKLRIAKGIKQKEMADMLQMKVSTYSNYENNHREPKFETILKIANILGVPVDYLTSSFDNYEQYQEHVNALKTSAEKKDADAFSAALGMPNMQFVEQKPPFGDQLKKSLEAQKKTISWLSDITKVDENILRSILNKEYVKISANDFGRITGALKMDYRFIDLDDKYIEIYHDETSYDKDTFLKEIETILDQLDEDDFDWIENTLNVLLERAKAKKDPD